MSEYPHPVDEIAQALKVDPQDLYDQLIGWGLIKDNPELLGCGHPADEVWFDRSFCPEPCGSMHNRCETCGVAVDGCNFEGEE